MFSKYNAKPLLGRVADLLIYHCDIKQYAKLEKECVFIFKFVKVNSRGTKPREKRCCEWEDVVGHRNFWY